MEDYHAVGEMHKCMEAGSNQLGTSHGRVAGHQAGSHMGRRKCAVLPPLSGQWRCQFLQLDHPAKNTCSKQTFDCLCLHT